MLGPIALIRRLPTQGKVVARNPASAVLSPGDAEAVMARPCRLPGFDLAAGLQRHARGRMFYHRLLCLFVDGHGDDVARLRACLATGQRDMARHLAHSLKGAAGMLGAVAVRCAARRWKSRWRRGEERVKGVANCGGRGGGAGGDADRSRRGRVDLAVARVDALESALPPFLPRSASVEKAAPQQPVPARRRRLAAMDGWLTELERLLAGDNMAANALCQEQRRRGAASASAFCARWRYSTTRRRHSVKHACGAGRRIAPSVGARPA